MRQSIKPTQPKDTIILEITISSIAILFVIFLIGSDLMWDFRQGAPIEHIISDGFIAIISIALTCFLGFRLAEFVRRAENSKHEIDLLRQDAFKWREAAKSHIEGLSSAINMQLENWELTPSEKEIAFHLILGLSMREIAQIRNTNEKTARAQAGAIYQKSGLGGRADLAAYFLADLLQPIQK